MNQDLDFLISDLKIINFRNHKELKLSSNNKFVLILGKNGIGKTNILEAISLLSASKGIRNAKNSDITNNTGALLKEWGIVANYKQNETNHKISLGCKTKSSSDTMEKILKLDDSNLKPKIDILKILRIIWITPQIENLLIQPQSILRKFVDRMSFNFFPEHAKDIIRYDYFLKSRNKILINENWNANWLKQIESELATLSISIIRNRSKCIELIDDCLEKLKTNYLKPKILLTGEIEDKIKNLDELEVIKYIENRLEKNRNIDKFSQRSSIGSHKTEVNILDKEKNQNAKICSTGEQKSMLLALMIGQSYAIYDHSKIAPIMLFDEIFSHLDNSRKEDLVFELKKIPSQIWITSTDMELGEFMSKNIDNLSVKNL
ncbi:MAG: DNA replication and repair protein RecF [Candidatus Midichloriaceae bacterium]|jgi:DNA replication and repair protein RecF